MKTLHRQLAMLFICFVHFFDIMTVLERRHLEQGKCILAQMFQQA
jgi:hypothetical protein